MIKTKIQEIENLQAELNKPGPKAQINPIDEAPSEIQIESLRNKFEDDMKKLKLDMDKNLAKPLDKLTNNFGEIGEMLE